VPLADDAGRQPAGDGVLGPRRCFWRSSSTSRESDRLDELLRFRRPGQPDLAERGERDCRRVCLDAQAMGVRGDRSDPGRELDPGVRRAGPGGRADEGARVLVGGREGGRPGRSARLRLRRGPLPGPRGAVHAREGRGDHRPRAGADRAADDAAGDADGRRGQSERGGPEGNAPLRQRALHGIPAGRIPPACPRVRPIDPEDGRYGGPALPPLRPRAADAGGGPAARVP
jgi:hypothetical protein